MMPGQPGMMMPGQPGMMMMPGQPGMMMPGQPGMMMPGMGGDGLDAVPGMVPQIKELLQHYGIEPRQAVRLVPLLLQQLALRLPVRLQRWQQRPALKRPEKPQNAQLQLRLPQAATIL
jgi:hypothetical protein